MSKQKIKPIREPLSRVWFLSRGYKQADPRHTNGYMLWLHPKTNDVLNQYGQKIKLKVLPSEKHMQKTTRYLALSHEHGDMLLARLKYLTFVGEIKPGYVIDHIDGNTFNNDIRNLRAVPDAINRRDGGFLRKLRNKGIIISGFGSVFILEGYARMAEWKATHTERQYKYLDRAELTRIFFGPTFKVADITPLDDLDINRHYDPFCERD
jgi:hypothetical protein